MQASSPNNPTERQALGLYVHIPFCKSKCGYCDFNTYAGIEALMAPFASALAQEAALWGQLLGRPRMRTVFFGGGTPSYIPREHLASVLSAARAAFQIDDGAEITIEANPDDVTVEGLHEIRAAGVNRISMGVQSLDDGLLRLLGRRHDAAEALRAYELAVQAGFDSVNLDLMYGLPRQSVAQWRDTLERVLTSSAGPPPHLSLYCLTVEHGTPLEALVKSGQVPQPDPDLAADMYLLAEERLAEAGYHHYEISNWALPGRQCRHNLIYWRNEPYLGLGPGAHSCLGGYRFHDLRSPRLYVERVRQWAERGTIAGVPDAAALAAIPVVEDVEAIGRRLEMAETMFLGLRLLDGLSIEGFRQRFGQSLEEAYGLQVRELVSDGLLERADGILRLTQRGHLLANQAFIRFLD